MLASPGFNPRNEAIVEDKLDLELVRRLSQPDPGRAASPLEEPVGSGALHQTVPPVAGTASFQELGPNRLRVMASTSVDRLLLLSEMYFPGWYATIDGQPAPIYRANYLFRGLVVPAGTHTIELRYRPQAAVAGALMSAIASTILGVVVLVGFRRRQTNGPKRNSAKSAQPRANPW
jgi:hypothetical protein